MIMTEFYPAHPRSLCSAGTDMHQATRLIVEDGTTWGAGCCERADHILEALAAHHMIRTQFPGMGIPVDFMEGPDQ